MDRDIDNFRVGEFRAEDLDEIVEIERGSFPSPWSRNIFLAEIDNPTARMLVGRDEGHKEAKVSGYIVYWMVADEMHLHNLAVRKEQRRHGIAAMLLREAIRSAKSEGARQITLEVRSSNFSAQSLYKKFGLSVKGVRPRYYGDTGEDALILWGEID